MTLAQKVVSEFDDKNICTKLSMQNMRYRRYFQVTVIWNKKGAQVGENIMLVRR